MEMSQLTKNLKTLKSNEHRIIYTSKRGVQVAVKHTGKFSPQDFAVSLIIPGKPEFNPTHIRLLIDLYIKRESNITEAKQFFKIFEKVFQGEDPEKFSEEVSKINFPMMLDEVEVNLYYAQLLMIEQDINYGPDSEKPSKLSPPRDYLMRFIRWVAVGDTQIDRIIFAAAGRKYPAPERYSKPIK